MEKSRLLSPSNQDEQESDLELKNKFLTFSSEMQLFGLSIQHVVQIIGNQEITAIPYFPKYAKGIISLRGLIIPIMDMRLRLGKPEVAYNDRTCIIVTNVNEQFAGLIVDQVAEVAEIKEEQISPPPTLTKTGENYLTGVAKMFEKSILILNSEKLLNMQSFSS